MEHCDVLVIGGGPAGSTLAWALRDSGLDVVIMDKQGFPRDKVCAGWVTPAVIESLSLDVEEYRRGRVFQPINGFRVARMGAELVQTDYGETVSYGIRRCEFDHYLLERSGARLRLQEPVKQIRREGDDWVVNDAVRARLVVGAGGHFCPVARLLGARPGSSETVVAAKEIEFELSAEQRERCALSGEVPELFFCRDLKGYGWAFRKGNHLNIGLGREDNHRLAEHLEAFCEELKRTGRIPADLPSRFKGHAYLLYPHAPRELLGEGVLLIGDAAGLAYAQSGEGIRPAVESALLAARVIREAAGDYSAARLAPYRERLSARFGERSPKPGLGAHLPEGIKQFLAGRLLATRWFVRSVVVDRWFLHRHQPALRA